MRKYKSEIDLNKIVEWGVGQAGEIDISPTVYSHKFESYEDACQYYDDVCEFGYGNRYFGPNEITIKDYIIDCILDGYDGYEVITNEELKHIRDYI